MKVAVLGNSKYGKATKSKGKNWGRVANSRTGHVAQRLASAMEDKV